MKILKLLNKKNLSIIFLFLFYNLSIYAEEQPIDIWNIDKKKLEIQNKKEALDEISEVKIESSIYNNQSDKKKDIIRLDTELVSKSSSKNEFNTN